MNEMLPSLQSKLAASREVGAPIFAAIRTFYENYESRVNYENRVAGVSEISENPSGRKDQNGDETMAYRSHDMVKMQGALVGAVRETQCTMTHMSRTRNPQPERKTSGSVAETAAQHHGDVAEIQLNPVTGTAGCKQLVPRVVARVLAAHETAYTSSTKSILEVVKSLQDIDTFTIERRKALTESTRKQDGAGKWSLDSRGLLNYKQALYVPADKAIREELLAKHHDDPLAGHYGIERTTELLRRKYYWDTIADDIKEYCQSCDACQRQAIPRHKPYGEMQSLPQPLGPWKEVTMDFVTGLPPSKRRGLVFDAILVIVDRYTKMAVYLPCTTEIDAQALAELFFEEVILRFGPPEGIISDRGSVFTSTFWSEICYYSKVKRRLSTAFHPQTDGQTERQNQSLERYLRVFCDENQSNWARLLAVAQFAYNNCKQASINVSPFYAMYGYNPTFELRIEDDTPRERVPAAQERVKELFDVRKKLEQRWQNVSKSQTKWYNKKHEPRLFKTDELVMLATKNLRLKQPSKKMTCRFIGPFRIAELVGKQAYRLHLPSTYSIHNVFHVSLLEPYTLRDGSAIPTFTLPELVNDEPQWEVEEVLDKRKRKGVTQFFVKWKGWPAEYDQWVDEQDMGDTEIARNDLVVKKRSKRRRVK